MPEIILEIIYAPSFVKQFNKLEELLKEEVVEKINQFKNKSKHTSLKVHRLHGKFDNLYNFSVNYKIRIILEYTSKNKVAILHIGDHDIYK